MLGKTIGHYKVTDRLGAGGMGVVWLAEDIRLGRKVALKMLREELTSSPEKRTRFEREARSVAALNHPNIVTLHSVEEADGVRFLTMEYVEGRTLAQRIVPGGLLPSDLLRIAAQVADALDAAHAAGIVHRDLKPGNILLAKDGRVKVVDFGLARAVGGESGPFGAMRRETSLTQEGIAIGTLNYMSPEQLSNKGVDHRSDLFALGVVMFEMATGEMPFPGDSAAQLISSVMRDRARRIDEQHTKLPPQIVDLVDALLAKNPNERPASAAEVRDRLLAAIKLLDSETSGVSYGELASRAIGRSIGGATRPQSRFPEDSAPRRSGRGRALARRLALGAIAVAIVAAVVFALARRARPVPSPAPAPVSEPSIAVLPLANFSGDADYFVDGMTDGLIGTLARIEGFRVISRQSVMHYKGSSKRLPEIAKELGVNYIVEGSLRREPDRLRLQIQLFRPEPEEQLWNDTFSRPSTELLSLPADVARSIATRLHVELSATLDERFRTVRAVDPKVFESYLRGRQLLEQARPNTIRTALELFEDALRRDPSFALAEVGRADAHGWLAYLFDDPESNAAQQEAAARRAIELDPGLPDAHAQLGDNLRYFRWDWVGAENEYRKAIALDASNAAARRSYWGLLASLGRLEEARPQAEEARRLDPLASLVEADLAWQALFERRFDESTTSFKRALELDPASPYAHAGLWQIADIQKLDPDRSRELQAWVAGMGQTEVANELARLPESSTYQQRVELAANRLEARTRTERVTLGLGAALMVSAGEFDRAVAWLERAHRERDPQLVWLAMDPSWEGVRDRPEVRTILEAMKLPLPAR